MILIKKDLEIMRDALKEYENKYYDVRDDEWQERINDLIDNIEENIRNS